MWVAETQLPELASAPSQSTHVQEAGIWGGPSTQAKAPTWDIGIPSSLFNCLAKIPLHICQLLVSGHSILSFNLSIIIKNISW